MLYPVAMVHLHCHRAAHCRRVSHCPHLFYQLKFKLFPLMVLSNSEQCCSELYLYVSQVHMYEFPTLSKFDVINTTIKANLGTKSLFGLQATVYNQGKPIQELKTGTWGQERNWRTLRNAVWLVWLAQLLFLCVLGLPA